MRERREVPPSVPDFINVEEEHPRQLRWLLGLLALGLAAALLITALTRMLSPAGTSWGSGQLVGGGYVLTCEHVVRGGVAVTVHWDGRAYAAEVVATSVQWDLALLEVEGVYGGGLPWRQWRVLGPGDTVVAVGYPAGSSRPVTVVGEILRVGASAMVPGDVRLDDLVMVHGAYEGGMSGAPLVNAWGEVVGVVSGSLAEGSAAGVGLAVSADSARRWLAAIAPQVSLPTGDAAERLQISQVAATAWEAAVRVQVTRARLDGQD